MIHVSITGDKDNIKLLEEIESNIGALSKAQKEIEDIAQTAENTPATKLLLEEGEPLFKTSDSTLQEMIDIEKTLESNARRKALLGLISDIQSTLSLSFATLKYPSPSSCTTLSLIPKRLSHFNLLPEFKVTDVPSDKVNSARDPNGTVNSLKLSEWFATWFLPKK